MSGLVRNGVRIDDTFAEAFDVPETMGFETMGFETVPCA